MIEVINFKSIFMGVNMYVLKCDGYAMVIDPTPTMKGDEIGDCVLEGIILTHEHYDHICGVELWKEKYGCPVFAGSNAVKGLADPRLNMSHYGSRLFETLFPGDASFKALGEIVDYSCSPDHVWEDGESYIWRGNELRIIHTPGHSAGSICVFLNRAYLFCGDTLLEYLPTGVRWKGSNKRRFMEETVPKLHTLDRETKVCPGHGDSFILQEYKYWGQTT